MSESNDTPQRYAADVDGRLVVIGGGEVAPALESLAATLGWPVSVGEFFDAFGSLTAGDAVVVLSHDEAVDAPAMAAALNSAAGYVGAMGSRRTRDRRTAWLTANGVAEDTLAQLHTPIGLDLRADTPAEIAVAIVAEIIARRRGAEATSLKGKTGPLHPHVPPGSVDCPG